jgi:tetratricopeptide (TPR) repeat protein
VPDEVVEGPPKPPPAGERLNRARDLAAAGRSQEAMDLYRDILSENPGNVRARNGLGELLEALGQHEQGLEQFDAALKVEPENVDVLVNRGSALGLLGRYEEAESELRRALRLAPEDVGVRAGVGILHFRRGLYAQAEAELRWVCEQVQDHGPAFFYRGEALNRLGKVEEAMAALERATVLQPRNAKAFYTLGILYDRKHLPEEAALMYRRARELQRP